MNSIQHHSVAVIILAAGLGTRMKSPKAKVLHEISGKPMIQYVVDTACSVAGNNVIVVVGHQADAVRSSASEIGDVHFALQEEQNGTGHAVLCAMPYVPENVTDVVILCGDVPLLSSKTVEKLFDEHYQNKNDVTVLAVELENPKGYGRMIVKKDGQVMKIVEEADASDAEKSIRIVNAGIYCVGKKWLGEALTCLKPDNAQNELYLTDIIEIGNRQQNRIGMLVSVNADEVIGINSKDELKRVETLLSCKESEIP